MTASAYNSSLAPPPPVLLLIHRLEALGPSKCVAFPLGLQCTTGCAPQTAWPLEAGLTSLLARYASASLRLHGISSSNAATQSRSGLMPLSCPSLMQSMGSSRPTVCEYWQSIAKALLKSSFGLRSAITLICGKIWKERNARVYNNNLSTFFVLLQK
jgi:hypothetical protein